MTNSNWLLQKRGNNWLIKLRRPGANLAPGWQNTSIQTIFSEPDSLHCSALLFFMLALFPGKFFPCLSQWSSSAPGLFTWAQICNLCVKSLKFGTCYEDGWRGGMPSRRYSTQPEFWTVRMGNGQILKNIQQLKQQGGRIAVEFSYKGHFRQRRKQEQKLKCLLSTHCPGVWEDREVRRM